MYLQTGLGQMNIQQSAWEQCVFVVLYAGRAYVAVGTLLVTSFSALMLLLEPRLCVGLLFRVLSLIRVGALLHMFLPLAIARLAYPS